MMEKYQKIHKTKSCNMWRVRPFCSLDCLAYNFSGGSDWGRKFVGLTKATWLKCFLELDSNDAIIEALTNLGTMVLSNDASDVTESLPTILRPLEIFTCKVSLMISIRLYHFIKRNF